MSIKLLKDVSKRRKAVNKVKKEKRMPYDCTAKWQGCVLNLLISIGVGSKTDEGRSREKEEAGELGTGSGRF